jgi:ABC-type spermidine/putrescine transport system permease subunit II
MNTGRLLRLTGRVVHEALLALVVLFMVVPTVIVILLSFSSDEFIRFPPSGWGFRQYATLASSDKWLEPLGRSLTLGISAALLAVLVGFPAVLALYRTTVPGREAAQFLGLGPLLAPSVAYAVALYGLFADLRLLGSFAGMLVVHVTLALPFVLLITGAAIARVPRELELAALSLGASRTRAWRDITLRLLLPAVVASFIFAFVVSFDEAIVTSFLSGIGFVTLPVAIFNSVRFGVDPVITAIATLLTVATALLLVVYGLLRRRA